jgi:hypothetical protein
MPSTILILTESIDEGITRLWHFQVSNKYEMVKWIIAHLAHYDETGMFQGISWQSGLDRWRASAQLTPETLLKAIDHSSIDGDSESRFEIHAINLSHNGEVAEDVTWTSEIELAKLIEQSSWVKEKSEHDIASSST